MVRYAKFLVVLAFAMLAAIPAFAQNGVAQNILRVKLNGFRSDKGVTRCGLYNDVDPSQFPSGDKPFKHNKSTIQNATAEVDFTDLSPGKYAVVCYHDENNNGKFDKSALGMPEEGYCFSNNVKPRFSAPNFSQCAFDFKGGDQAISMTMIN